MINLNSSSKWDGEGNGNSLQCSCLGNPRDRGAWWSSVYGVMQSWTRLTQLSSSSKWDILISIFCLQCRRPWFNPCIRKISWRRKWQPTPILLPEKSHVQRSLVDYSPWDREESDTTLNINIRHDSNINILTLCVLTSVAPSSQYFHSFLLLSNEY